MKQKLLFSFSRKPLIIFAILLLMFTSAKADDIDVYRASMVETTKPNIMFILDYSASMKLDSEGNQTASSGLPSRFDILKSAVISVLETNKDKINAGIGSIYRTSASGVRWPASELSADAHFTDPDIPIGQYTNADIINIQLESENPYGETATVNALAETASYFRGDSVRDREFGSLIPTNHRPDLWQTEGWYAGTYEHGAYYTAIPASYLPRDAYKFGVNLNGSYAWCRNNDDGANYCEGYEIIDCTYIPGQPYYFEAYTNEAGEHTPAKSGNYAGYSNCTYKHPDSWERPNYESPITQECQSNFMVLVSDGEPTSYDWINNVQTILDGETIWTCEDLSTSIFNETINSYPFGNCGPEIVNKMATTDANPDIPGSIVKTFTVGFSLEDSGKKYLELLAKEGKGKFFEATNAASLAAALNNVIAGTLAESQNFSELSIDVDRDSFSHDNRAFFSLFTPSGGPNWQGNLKGYFIDDTGLMDVNGQPATIIDDEAGLRFSDTAQSFWSPTIDGDSLTEGGASGLIVSTEVGARNLYTYTGDSIPIEGVSLAQGDDTKLTKENSAITATMLGPKGVVMRDAALDWLQQAPMGDPLHTKPVMINYGNRKVLYTMTNQGLIHAIDASRPLYSASSPDHGGGEELFAYMPKELLENLPELFSGVSEKPHIYGLDGALVRWHDDTNNDGIVNNGEDVKLVFGMRRGGQQYYALDVSNPEQPILKWSIKGGTGDFSNLAQSWSRPSLISVKYNDEKKRIMVFGGGFDATTLDKELDRKASTGNAIYFIDEDGLLIKSISEIDNADMVYAIPSDPTVIDSDVDGFADRLYIGDLGGQIWRLDFDDIYTGNVTTTLLAKLHNGEYQPFFYSPSVALVNNNGDKYYAIAVGSGDRTQPVLGTSNNQYYMLQDFNIDTGPPSETVPPILYSDLYDASDNDLGSTDASVRTNASESLSQKQGWRIRLNIGEKALSKVTLFDGKYMATTFEPSTNNGDSSCSFASQSQLYIMSLEDAQPIQFLSNGEENSSGLMASDRITKLSTIGIPSSPQLIFPKDSTQIQVMVDKETINLVNRKLTTIFWYAQ